jgi:DNA-binding SARP family transcriptional activator
MSLRVSVLGPLVASIDGAPVAIGGDRPRVLLARLAVDAPTAVRTDQLVEAIWGDAAPAKAANTLQVHVSNLRRAVGRSANGEQILQTQHNGYGLAVTADQLDLLRFIELVQSARAAADDHDHEAAAAAYRRALDIPSGEPLADLLDNEWAVRESAAINQRIDGVWREWVVAELGAGHHLALVPPLESRLREHSLDEGVAAMLVLALYRAGRQTDALRVLSDVRRRLSDEIGVDPGPELAELENRILTHDPRLRNDRVAADLATVTRVRSDDPAAVLLVAGRRHVLSADLITIGRHHDQHVVIDDVDVSREHAVLERRPGGFRLADRGSTNGTWVNGERVDEVDLTDGDELWFGSIIATFRASETATEFDPHARASGTRPRESPGL